MAVTTAYGGDDRIVHRAVTTASQYTICVCLRYLRSQFGSGSFSSARVGACASQTVAAPPVKQKNRKRGKNRPQEASDGALVCEICSTHLSHSHLASVVVRFCAVP